MNYIARRDLLSLVEKIEQKICCVGEMSVNATEQGVFTGNMFTQSGLQVLLDSVLSLMAGVVCVCSARIADCYHCGNSKPE